MGSGGIQEVPTRDAVVVHLCGSCTSQYYEGVSMIYVQECLKSVKDADKRFEHHTARVHLNGKWSIDDLSDDAPQLSLGEACQALQTMAPDVVVPHMFDYLGMTSYRALFDILGVEILGCRPEAMAISTHKGRSKAIVAEAGVRVPRSVTLREGDDWSKLDLPLPAIVKPCEEDNSMGVTKVEDHDGLASALPGAFQFGDEVLVEEYVPLGRELRVGIIEEADGSLRMLEITEYLLDEASAPIRTPADKLQTNTEGVPTSLATGARKTPANEVSEELWQRLYDAASRSHRVLGCRDYSIYDFRVSPDDRPYFLECSLYCSFAPRSALIVMGEASGMQHPTMFTRMCDQAVARADRRSQASASQQLMGMKKL